ncbi:MAG: hemerythrin domain-containing protein [Leptonema sp. (in: bacteria)]
MGLKEYLTKDHKECDQLFANFENSLQKKDFENILKTLDGFTKKTIRHFKIEEEILFPLFEEKTQNTMGPTQVMRMEHQEISFYLEELKKLSENLNSNTIHTMLSITETIVFLLQQHNLKEEQILYTMFERVLDHQDQLLEKISNFSL